MVKGLEGKIYIEQTLSLFDLGRRRLKETLLWPAAPHRGAVQISGDSGRTQGNGMELQQGKVRLYIRKSFFTKKHWNRLSRAVIISRSCWNLRSVWTILSVLWSNFQVVSCGTKSWTWWSQWIFSNLGFPMILWKGWLSEAAVVGNGPSLRYDAFQSMSLIFMSCVRDIKMSTVKDQPSLANWCLYTVCCKQTLVHFCITKPVHGFYRERHSSQ